MSSKEYSCVKKTKRTFEDSLAELAKKYPINKITVKMLCEKSEMSRNAFYFHYADIYDLISKIEDNLIHEVEDLITDFRKVGFPDNVLETLKRLPELLLERRDITLMLLDSNFSNSFTERLNKLFSDLNYEYFNLYHKNASRDTFDYFYNFISDGYYGMFRRMLKNPESISVEKFISLSYTLVKRLIVLDDPDIMIEKF